MTTFGRYLIGEDDVWKYFKYWLSYSHVLLKHWTYFPKNMLINSKTRYLLNFFYNLISAFNKFQWMLHYLLVKIIFFELILISFINSSFFMYSFWWFLFYSIWTFAISIMFSFNFRIFLFVQTLDSSSLKSLYRLFFYHLDEK